MTKPNQQAILLFALVFALFYVTVFGDICIVDDFDTIMSFANSQGTSLREIFYPRSALGGYYRPLIMLSYLLNLHLWDLDGRTLHLENVLVHAANAFLVFQLARSVLPRPRREGSLAPLVAGLLFGLHPIATESVDWISGRTDLIAGFFVLLAALLLVRYTRARSGYLLAGAALSILVGLLAKETALALIPGAFFLLAAHREDGELPIADSGLSRYHDSLLFLLFAGGTVLVEVSYSNFWIVLAAAPLYLLSRHWLCGGGIAHRGAVLLPVRRMVGSVAAVLIAVGIFFGVRSVVFTSDLPRIPQTISLMLRDFNYTLQIFLGGVGFYVKKFFCPFPLNFAIREIDPYYALAGTVLCFVGLLLATRRTWASSLALAGVFMFAPALPLALGTVAWTAYAERYIYISTAFWSVALVLWCAPRLERYGRAGVAAVTLLLLIMGGATLSRNLIWQTSLSLLRDTVLKSPQFREVHVIYMNELLKIGDLAGAREQYRIASALPSVGYNERLDSIMAELLLKEGKKDEALGLYRKMLDKTRGKSRTARRQIENLLQAKLARAEEPAPDRASLGRPQRLPRPAPGAASPRVAGGTESEGR